MSKISHLLVPGGGERDDQELGDHQEEITWSEPKRIREGDGDHSSGIQIPEWFRFTRRGRVNFGLSGMSESARTAASAIGSKEEEDEMDINFRTYRD